MGFTRNYGFVTVVTSEDPVTRLPEESLSDPSSPPPPPTKALLTTTEMTSNPLEPIYILFISGRDHYKCYQFDKDIVYIYEVIGSSAFQIYGSFMSFIWVKSLFIYLSVPVLTINV